jgi:CubicO group peptidase (beta-lactamase class C family)
MMEMRDHGALQRRAHHPRPIDARRLQATFELVRQQSSDTPGGYAALGLADRSGPLSGAAFLSGGLLDGPRRSAIASITKPITATAIMQLVQDGAVDLDEPIATYVPGFSPQWPIGVRHPALATVRHVLSHTSGLSDIPDAMLRELAPTSEAMVRALGAQRLRFDPGSAFGYASDSYFLLSAVIERVSGLRYTQFISRHIVQPLGMDATTFDPREPGPPGLAPEGSFGPAEMSPHEVLALAAGLAMPGGGLWSTPDDMLRFGMAMLSGGRLEHAQLLDASLVGRMVASHAGEITDHGTGQPVQYGLGWGRPGLEPGSRASASAFGHTGATGSALVVDPANDLVIVYLRNWWDVSMAATTEAINAVYATIRPSG